MPEKSQIESQIEEEPKLTEVGFVSLTARHYEEKHEKNEDAALGEEDDVEARQKLIFGVFDGVGGAKAGEIASRMAKKEIWQILKEIKMEASADLWVEAIKNALSSANKKIFAWGSVEPEWQGMATTATLVKIIEKPEGGAELVYGHAGDTRLYILRAEGNLEQVTLDDTANNEILTDFSRAGVITLEQVQKFTQGTSMEEIEEAFRTEKEKEILRSLLSNRSIIEQYLGMSKKKFKPAVGKVNLKSGDRVIITSDGIHDNLTDEQIKNLLSVSADDQEAAEKIANGARLISESGKFRSKDDDMTILVKTIK